MLGLLPRLAEYSPTPMQELQNLHSDVSEGTGDHTQGASSLAAFAPGASTTMQSPSGSKDESDQAAQNSQDRRLAFNFLRRAPLGMMILIRLVMEPLRHYMT